VVNHYHDDNVEGVQQKVIYHLGESEVRANLNNLSVLKGQSGQIITSKIFFFNLPVSFLTFTRTFVNT